MLPVELVYSLQLMCPVDRNILKQYRVVTLAVQVPTARCTLCPQPAGHFCVCINCPRHVFAVAPGLKYSNALTVCQRGASNALAAAGEPQNVGEQAAQQGVESQEPCRDQCQSSSHSYTITAQTR